MLSMKVIFVFAHPDDESFSSGGTIADLTQKGITVKLITATRGEKGQFGNPPVATRENLGKVREKELREAGKVLGISEIFFLGFKDGNLINTPKKEIVNKILEILEKENPDIVVTFNKEGGSRHPDHMTMSAAATSAFKKYMIKANKHVKLYHAELLRSFVGELKKQGIMYNAYGEIKGTPDFKITTIVDIAKTIDKKIEALKCHRTQNKDWERFLKRLKNQKAHFEYFRLIKENGIV